jgi:hypothetical protein
MSSDQETPPLHMGFNDLPPKVRFQIYDLLNEARVVELSFDENLSTFWTTTKPPVGLSISAESRRATERNYVRAFTGTRGNVWFNFERDTLFFGTSFLL